MGDDSWRGRGSGQRAWAYCMDSGDKSPSGDDDRGGREQVRRVWSPPRLHSLPYDEGLPRLPPTRTTRGTATNARPIVALIVGMVLYVFTSIVLMYYIQVQCTCSDSLPEFCLCKDVRDYSPGCEQ